MKTTKRKPNDPYECLCMPCKECIFYDKENEKCLHPDDISKYIKTK